MRLSHADFPTGAVIGVGSKHQLSDGHTLLNPASSTNLFLSNKSKSNSVDPEKLRNSDDANGPILDYATKRQQNPDP